MSDPGDDIVKEFLVESYENLDQLDRDFVSLEQEPASRELLGRVFRTIHTIKGTCGFLGFHRLQAVTHSGEGLLSHLRDGTLLLNPEMATALLALVDAVRAILGRIERGGEEGEERYDGVIAELERFQSLAPTRPIDPRALSNFAPSVPYATPVAAPPAPTPPATATAASAPAAAVPPATAPAATAPTAKLEQTAAIPPADAPGAQLSPRAEGHEILEAQSVNEEERGAGIADGSVRVNVRLLDRLVTLVSELVLARNQILQHVAARDAAALPATSQRLNLITSELQEGIMRTRMQPIGNLWNKLPRLARDVAASCGKQVRLEMDGRDTELDKTVLEAIRDPLTHLMRNAIDHGIESPEVRVACRKNAEGRVLLRAYHQGGKVHLEISDDGAGLPIERIRRKAIERKLISHQRAAQMNDRECADLIFTPGFSTAQTVTSISGRGVGMDVVKTNIEQIGGTVDLHSQPTVGTTIFLTIPLTLAIVPALIVTDDGERFAIPQAGLLEVLRIVPAQIPQAVEWVHEAPVFRLRERLLPLVFLRELLNERRPFGPQSMPDRQGRALHIAVLDAEGRTFGLVVDDVNDAEEIVVKPLGEPLKNVTVLAGATILGDGHVGLILDVPGLARAAGIADSVERTPRTAIGAVNPLALNPHLVVEVRSGWRVAVPLARVTRLEEFARAWIERTGERDVVQYRGSIVPIARLARLLDPRMREEPWPARIPAVIFESYGRPLALAVSKVVDIVNEPPEAQPVVGRPGIAAAAVLQGRVVDLLDLDAVLALAAAEIDFAGTAGAGT